MYFTSSIFFRVREAESDGRFAGEASCQTQRVAAMAGDLQGCASGHGEIDTSFSKFIKLIFILFTNIVDNVEIWN